MPPLCLKSLANSHRENRRILGKIIMKQKHRSQARWYWMMPPRAGE